MGNFPRVETRIHISNPISNGEKSLYATLMLRTGLVATANILILPDTALLCIPGIRAVLMTMSTS